MKKKLHLNSAVSVIYQIATIVIGLILPRLTMSTYGSDVNGLASSITQMLGFISFLELGVGVIVQTSLYKPLAENDTQRISVIYAAAQRYFRRIAQVLLVYILGLCVYYGVFRSDSFSWVYTSTLIIAISINSFAQYYFGLCNVLLLNADQKVYIPTSINLVTIIINGLTTILLMKTGFSIQFVKLVSSLIFLCRPIFLSIYVQRYYNIIKIQTIPGDVLKDKWSGVAQHVSAVLTGSIDYIVLTLLSTFQAVSIYSVYVMPLNSIRNLIVTVSTGYKSFFGNIIARGNQEELKAEFNRYEFLSHILVSIVFGCASVVIVPFISVYTRGINDANYIDYTFAILITIAYAIFSLQIPYTSVIFSAGHFRQTQDICIWECVINIVISAALVKFIGISGVAIGTICAVLYRIVASIVYLRKAILYRGFKKFSLLMVADMISFVLINIASKSITFSGNNYFDWALYSLLIAVISLCVTGVVFKIIFPESLKAMQLNDVFKRRR